MGGWIDGRAGGRTGGRMHRYIDKQAGRQAGRQTDRQTNRQTDGRIMIFGQVLYQYLIFSSVNTCKIHRYLLHRLH